MVATKMEVARAGRAAGGRRCVGLDWIGGSLCFVGARPALRALVGPSPALFCTYSAPFISEVSPR